MTAEGGRGPLDLLLELELPVVVRFGTTRMPLGEVMQLDAGSVIDFDGASENALEVLVSNRVVARGEAVLVEGAYGVRITEVLSDATGLRAES
jgi:flagellar motor switch protein FliN